MKTYTQTTFETAISIQENIYDLLVLQVGTNPDLLELTQNLYKTICVLKATMKYEAETIELPFKIESIKQREYV